MLVRLDRRGIAHNDLAKEPNWLVTPAGAPAVVDFQLALVAPLRERNILAGPAAISRLWGATGKRAYTFLTRRVFGC